MSLYYFGEKPENCPSWAKPFGYQAPKLVQKQVKETRAYRDFKKSFEQGISDCGNHQPSEKSSPKPVKERVTSGSELSDFF